MVTQIFWLCTIWWKSSCVIIQKVTRQFFVVVLFKILFNVVLPFSSSVKILAFDFPNKSYKAVLLHGPNLLGKVLKQSFLHGKCVMQLPWKKKKGQLRSTLTEYYSAVSTAPFCDICWFALSTAPGLGYGRIWNNGPLAVVSTPVFASPFLSKPVDHVPLWKMYSY